MKLEAIDEAKLKAIVKDAIREDYYENLKQGSYFKAA